MKPATPLLLLSLITLLPCALPGVAAAADSGKVDTSSLHSLDDVSGSEAEHVNVENIKSKYWARGDESELGVVQNRLYSKEHKIEVGVFGGVVATDPFLQVNSVGGS